jgi:two-component system, chemotaxis family, CheB/CheR fusion protein
MEIQCNRGVTHYRMIAFPIGEDLFVLSVQDISEEKKEYLARHHLASIVDTSEDAIYSLSLNGKILSWNRGAQNFYGYSAEEVLQMDISLLTPDLEQSDHIDLIREVVSGNTLSNLEHIHRSKNGKIFPVYLTKSPICDRYGNVIAVSNIVKNISRIKDRETELIRAREKAEKAGMMKTAFLQNVSHEIRTPMNSILGFTDILKKRINSGENLRYIQAVENSGNQLVRIIDDILDISRMEANELHIYKSTFDLHKLLGQVREQFEGVKNNLGKKHIGLNLLVPDPAKDVCLHTDRQRLRQVLDNLLSNAVKNTDTGKIELGYTPREDDLLFFVRDTGRGIRKSQQKSIFKRFNRIENESTKALNGTGLGLSISKGLVRKLGGDIWVESEFGKGSTFYFCIPYEDSGEPVYATARRQEREQKVPDLEGKTILVAEDDVYSLQMLLVMLSETKAEILYAKDGREALEITRSHQIDLALLDIRLPEISGYELLRRIRQENNKIILIAQTAYAMPEETKKILKAGFEEHLKKPISYRALFGVLNRHFSDR